MFWGAISGFLLVYVGAYMYFLGLVAWAILFFVYLRSRPAFAWALLIGGGIGAVCPGSCIANMLQLYGPWTP
jgi:hypothetical protein